MGATSTYGWTYPDLADLANGPAAFQEALTDVENTVKDTTILSYTPTWSSTGAAQPSGASTITGRYRVDHGICFVWMYLQFGASVNGGVGNLRLTVPLAAAASPLFQFLQTRFFASGAGGGLYQGIADITPGTSTIVPYFPGSPTEGRLDQWRNTSSGAVGDGIPLVSGNYPIVNGSSFVASGHYIL